jgi:hypothetical protein
MQSIQEPFVFRPTSKDVHIKIYKIVILPVVLYECEISSRTLRERQIESVRKKKIPKQISGQTESDRRMQKHLC